MNRIITVLTHTCLMLCFMALVGLFAPQGSLLLRVCAPITNVFVH